MAANSEVTSWLDEREAAYEVLEHENVFSAVDEAQALDVEAGRIAKSLVVHITHPGPQTTGTQAVVIIPGGERTSNQKLHELFGTDHARLALEDELSQDFPQFELGAVPPLAGLIELPVYIDRRLVDHDTVLFNAGTHTASIKMMMHDFINLADAAVVDIVDEREAA